MEGTENTEVRFCWHCGAKIKPGMVFCAMCGSELMHSDIYAETAPVKDNERSDNDYQPDYVNVARDDEELGYDEDTEYYDEQYEMGIRDAVDEFVQHVRTSEYVQKGKSAARKGGAYIKKGVDSVAQQGGEYLKKGVDTGSVFLKKGVDTGSVYLKKGVEKGVDELFNTIEDLTGEEGKTEIHLKELVSEIPKKHTTEEREALFICGTSTTTPSEAEMVAVWPKPWLYSRVFLVLSVVFVGLYLMLGYFENTKALAGLMFIGAMVVPFSLMVFFWEINVPRNVSIFDCVTVFFIGGVFSIICTLAISRIFSVDTSSDNIGALATGITEELAKLIVIVLSIKRRNSKYLLNGLLIGACVGAGFAVFETAGYACQGMFADLLEAILEDRGLYEIRYTIMMHTIMKRAYLSVGGHIIWAAMEGFALVAAKGMNDFKESMLLDKRVLVFTGIAICLHTLWDMPFTITQSEDIPVKQILLCILGLTIILVLISAGLRQISRLSTAANHPDDEQSAADAESNNKLTTFLDVLSKTSDKNT